MATSSFQTKRTVLTGIAAVALVFAGLALWKAWRFQTAGARSAKATEANKPKTTAGTFERPAHAPQNGATEKMDFEVEVALLRGRLEQASPEEIMTLLNGIAMDRPATAIELAQSLGRTEAERSAWVSDLAKQWTLRAPQEAWNWLAQLPSARMDNFAEGNLPGVIFSTLAAHDPAALVRGVDGLLRAGESPTGVSPAVAVHLGLESLIENNSIDAARRAVENWASDPAKPPIGESAYITVANGLRATDPQGAGRWLLAQPPSEDRDVALAEFSAHWAQTDPRTALQWAESLPDGLQMKAVQRTFNDWVERDSAPATQWLGDFLARAPVHAETDRLVESLINLNSSLQSSPTDSLQWAGLLSDPAKRIAYEEKVALKWGSRDLNAATSYVWNSPTIPADRKQAIIQKMRSGQDNGFNE